jgi:two-component system response regulator VicR
MKRTDIARPKPLILFVEDDPSLAFATKDNLEVAGYEVIHCSDGLAGLEAFSEYKFDFCILDVMLPRMDGFTLARKIRETNQDVPILFLTARALQDDKIQGFKLGADDYLTKPFSIQELILRMEVFLRRSKDKAEPEKEATRFVIGDFEFDFQKLTLSRNGHVQTLTFREGEVLKYFASHRNEVVRREDLLKAIWGDDDYYMGRSLDVFISRLRKYLATDANSVKIDNVHGIGFRMSW